MKKLKFLLLVVIILFYLHGIEEILTNFYLTDPLNRYFANKFQIDLRIPYYSFNIALWVILPFCYFLFSNKNWIKGLLGIIGVVMIFEFDHLIRAVMAWSYYPGLYTSLLFPVLSIFYWKEYFQWLKNPV